jgi:hypothetical protein
MKSKIKITREGQRCRKCQTPVVRQTHLEPPEPYVGGYYFEWWLLCPKCRVVYLQEEAKHWFSSDISVRANLESGSESADSGSVGYNNPNWKVRPADVLPWSEILLEQRGDASNRCGRESGDN